MKFRAFLEEAPNAFFAHDLEGRFTDVNRKACDNLGYTREELLKMTVMEVDQNFDLTAARAFWEKAPGEVMTLSGLHRRKDGTVFPVEIHLSVYMVDSIKTILAMVHDITQRLAVEARQERLAKLYRALSEVNQAIVRMEDEETLFPLVCRMAVDFGGLKLAWIGRLSEESGLIRPVVCYGSGADYLEDIAISASGALPEGRGPAGTAWRENRIVIVNDYLASVSTQPWHRQGRRFGWRSSGAFPISRGGKPFALLGVYHDHEDAFDDAIIGLLDEMTRDISFALDNFDREKERKSAENALRVSEEKFSRIFRSCPNPVSITSLADGRFIDANEAWSRVIGYDREEAMGETAVALGIWVNPHDRAVMVDDLACRGEIRDREIVFRTKMGSEVICLVSAAVIAIQGDPFVVLVAQDITELKQAMSTIAEQNNFLNAIFDSEPECVKVVSPDGNLVQMNRAGLAMLEVDTLAEARQTGLDEFVLRGHRQAFAEFHASVCSGISGMLEFPITGRKGTLRWLETHATPLRNLDGEIVGLLGVTRDVTGRKLSDELIWKQANFDLLTDLPNRHMFHDRLDQEIRKVHRDGGMLAIFLIDLDHFKEINDTLGHQIGDMLLLEAAQRIVSCVREADTVARLGGDEFTVILTQPHDTVHIENIAQHIISRLVEPYRLGGETVYASASLGITIYPADAPDGDQLLKHADQAMYAAKNAGRNRFSYFTNDLQETAQSRLRLLNDLRGALAANQFLLYFQPIVELSTGRVVKAEALLRWKHPVRGLVNPMEFIPLAEEAGLIGEIGDWVFRESLRMASRWAGLIPEFQVSVNGSAAQFQNDAGSVDSWLDYLRELGLSGRNIAIEITESLLLDAGSVITDRLHRLRETGIQLAIDDFGTGYSALSYLKKFDIDYLKIDRTFVRDLATEPSDMALSEAIIVMAHKLGLKVTAEGVETAAQRNLLVEAGCDYAQGYLFSRPVPAEEFERGLNRGGSAFFQPFQQRILD